MWLSGRVLVLKLAARVRILNPENIRPEIIYFLIFVSNRLTD